MKNPFKKKSPTIYTQAFSGDLFTQVTGRNKKGYNLCFQYHKPEDFARTIHNPYLDYCFTIAGNKVAFWSREDIKEVVVHTIPDDLRDRKWWYKDFDTVWNQYINGKDL